METATSRVQVASASLLGMWLCVPVEMTADDTAQVLTICREHLGPIFDSCPDAYVLDRLYGGFECAIGPERRHVYFALSQYSFLAAEFWENTASGRASTWAELLSHNPEHYGDGPFTADYPKESEL